MNLYCTYLGLLLEVLLWCTGEGGRCTKQLLNSFSSMLCILKPLWKYLTCRTGLIAILVILQVSHECKHELLLKHPIRYLMRLKKRIEKRQKVSSNFSKSWKSDTVFARKIVYMPKIGVADCQHYYLLIFEVFFSHKPQWLKDQKVSHLNVFFKQDLFWRGEDKLSEMCPVVVEMSFFIKQHIGQLKQWQEKMWDMVITVTTLLSFAFCVLQILRPRPTALLKVMWCVSSIWKNPSLKFSLLLALAKNDFHLSVASYRCVWRPEILNWCLITATEMMSRLCHFPSGHWVMEYDIFGLRSLSCLPTEKTMLLLD